MYFRYPLHAVWCVTNLCNAQCKHCSSAAGKPFQNELSTREGIELIKQLSEISIFDLAFSGGEPLLRRDIYELMKYAVDQGFIIGIGTNGLIINEKIAKRLQSLENIRVQVSLDGATPATHDKIRRIPGSFTRAVNAIKILKKDELRTHVCFTPNLINYHEIEAIIDLCVELGVDLFNLSQFVPIGRGSKDIDLSPQQWKWILEIWHNKKHQFEGTMEFSSHEAQLALVEKEVFNMPAFIGCQAGNAVCCISPEGVIYPCVMLPLGIGSIKKQTFREIWETSEVVKNLKDRRKLRGKCGNCTYRDICGGCRGVAFVYSDYLDEDPRCWYEHP